MTEGTNFPSPLAGEGPGEGSKHDPRSPRGDMKPHPPRPLSPKATKAALLVGAAVAVAWLVMTAAAWLLPRPERLTAEPSTVVEFHDGTVAHVFLSPDDKWRVPVSL